MQEHDDRRRRVRVPVDPDEELAPALDPDGPALGSHGSLMPGRVPIRVLEHVRVLTPGKIEVWHSDGVKHSDGLGSDGGGDEAREGLEADAAAGGGRQELLGREVAVAMR